MTRASRRNLYGLVLTGGRSQRMGRDKAALLYHDQPQLARACQLLQRICSQVFVSARADQRDTLRQQWPAITDQHENIGPLAGIAAAQLMHPQVAWLVVACDLPWLDGASLEQLLQSRDPAHMATAFHMPGCAAPEPLCTIWEPASAAAVQAAIATGQHSPSLLLNSLDVLLVAPHNPLALRNINTPGDYHSTLHQMSQPTIQLTIQYFALFREQAGQRSEVLSTHATTVAALYEQLQQRYGFRLQPTQLKAAINNEFRDWRSELKNGDVVTFIPPVAGG